MMTADVDKKALKSGVWYTIANFFVKAVSVITMPIIIRLLTKNEYGLYHNYVSWMSLLTVFITLNLHSTFISAKHDYEQCIDKYIVSMLGLSTLVGCAWLVGINIFYDSIKEFIGLDRKYINILVIYLIMTPAIDLFQAREIYSFNYKKSVVLSVSLSLVTAVLSVLLVYICEDKLLGRIIGLSLPTIVLGFVLTLLLLKEGKCVDFSCWKYALPICLPYIPHILSLTVLNSTDKIMIKYWCGTENEAIYGCAYSCATLVTTLMASINSAIAPWIGEKLNSKEYNEIRTFSRKYILCFFAFSLLVVLFTPEIILILGSKEYIDAIYVFVPVIIGCNCQFVYTLFVNVEQFAKRTRPMALASIVAALTNVGLNCLLIPRYGYQAAAYTTLIGYLVLLVMHMVIVYKIKLSMVYDYKFIIVSVLAVIGIMLLSLVLFENTIVRVAVIVGYIIILAFIAYKNKAYISMLLKKIIK